MATETAGRAKDYKAMIREAVSCGETFLRLTMSGGIRGESIPWTKAVVRPVELRGERHYQFIYYESKKGITKNYSGAEFPQRLEALLSMPFRFIHVQTTSGDLHIRITKKGKVLLTKARPSRTEPRPHLAHNRVKGYPIPRDTPDRFLQGIGIMDSSGEVKPTMQNKFRQINEFIRLMSQAIARSGLAGRELTIVDCGCGNAYLTFAGYHYLHHIQGVSVRVIGIDREVELIEQCNELCDSLGWSGLEFFQARIADYAAEVAPDIVLSLHACDTATDEAIAQGVVWQSPIILAAPCCQHELRPQIEASLFEPVLKHGILKQRTADILTDACRAQILRILGYRTDVVQFIDSKHTPKNLMIRAEKTSNPGNRSAIAQYKALTDFWKIEPSIERLLQDELAPYLERD